ncbi:hypothetical protein TVAG_313980 [Trichomonas vaginalis G3]|uniref:Uncharacterized protein n=1 Tax=Trichomonas vaginalis (strain ATCC PRA-98 / G3) TaxID=412133 RepID=A2EKJ6_TRIV3|nr:hypothetical protein TVAGG3_0412290 [Trichomonas vaginalis G3]EAY06823.1 hypothetical protein TVAG_313980 [Trichomonas vaginalis G3]KAI5535439.1 hypothetical protein TVAGG3_0412290 [Trichomonas vaginalis G3]|eukprot:XP_001319046.1 hypothetical protein [Trichomonas vaginalis G3]
MTEEEPEYSNDLLPSKEFLESIKTYYKESLNYRKDHSIGAFHLWQRSRQVSEAQFSTMLDINYARALLLFENRKVQYCTLDQVVANQGHEEPKLTLKPSFTNNRSKFDDGSTRGSFFDEPENPSKSRTFSNKRAPLQQLNDDDGFKFSSNNNQKLGFRTRF